MGNRTPFIAVKSANRPTSSFEVDILNPHTKPQNCSLHQSLMLLFRALCMPHKINCALSGHGKSKLPLLGVARLRMRGQTIQRGKIFRGKPKMKICGETEQLHTAYTGLGCLLTDSGHEQLSVQGWAVSVAVLTSQYYNIIRRGLIRVHVFVYERASFTTALHVIQDTRLLPAGIQPSICIGTFSYSYKIHKKWVRVWQRVHGTIRQRVSRECIHAFPLPRKINRQISNCNYLVSGNINRPIEIYTR